MRCPCAVDGSCSDGFSCFKDTICLPAQCEAGARGCVCSAGRCIDARNDQCDDNLCVAIPTGPLTDEELDARGVDKTPSKPGKAEIPTDCETGDLQCRCIGGAMCKGLETICSGGICVNADCAGDEQCACLNGLCFDNLKCALVDESSTGGICLPQSSLQDGNLNGPQTTDEVAQASSIAFSCASMAALVLAQCL